MKEVKDLLKLAIFTARLKYGVRHLEDKVEAINEEWHQGEKCSADKGIKDAYYCIKRNLKTVQEVLEKLDIIIGEKNEN